MLHHVHKPGDAICRVELRGNDRTGVRVGCIRHVGIIGADLYAFWRKHRAVRRRREAMTRSKIAGHKVAHHPTYAVTPQ